MEYIALVGGKIGLDLDAETLIYIAIGFAVAVGMLLVIATRGD